VAGVDPGQTAVGQIQAHELAGDEAFGAELLGHHLVHRRERLFEPQATPAAVAVAAHRQVGHAAGLEAVAHGVDDRHVGQVAVDRVIEGVARDLVGRLQHAGQRHPVVGEGQRREHGPPELGGEVHVA
jgi:hypothetical protein